MLNNFMAMRDFDNESSPDYVRPANHDRCPVCGFEYHVDDLVNGICNECRCYMDKQIGIKELPKHLNNTGNNKKK